MFITIGLYVDIAVSENIYGSAVGKNF